MIVAAGLIGCTAVTWFDDGTGKRSCKAYCRTLAEDGESCIEWTDAASDACVGKYTSVGHCCISGGGSCPLASPGLRGFDCYCPVATAYGTTYVAGKGCIIEPEPDPEM